MSGSWTSKPSWTSKCRLRCSPRSRTRSSTGSARSCGRQPRDQCQLRRRAIITACLIPTAGPVIIAIGLAVLILITTFNLLAIGLLLLVGFRGVSYSALNPLDPIPTKTWAKLKPPVWFYKKRVSNDHWKDVHYTPRLAIFWVLNPPFIIAGVLLLLFVPNKTAVLTFLVALVFFQLVLSASAIYLSRTEDDRRQNAQRRYEEEKKRREAELARELELLACETKPRDASIGSLPPSRRTVRLRYQELKAQVCKPFAT